MSLCDLIAPYCVYWVDGSSVVINDDMMSELSKRMHLALLDLSKLSHPPYHRNLQPVVQRL